MLRGGGGRAELRIRAQVVGEPRDVCRQFLGRVEPHAVGIVDPDRRTEGVEVDDREWTFPKVAQLVKPVAVKRRFSRVRAEDHHVGVGDRPLDLGLFIGLDTNSLAVLERLAEQFDLSTLLVAPVKQRQ